MKIQELAQAIDGNILSGEQYKYEEIHYGFASDLMSDVLRLEADHLVLLTGLVNTQAVRTAEMSDINCIVFVRGKEIDEAVCALARENDMVIISTGYSMFKSSGLLFKAGLEPVY